MLSFGLTLSCPLDNSCVLSKQFEFLMRMDGSSSKVKSVYEPSGPSDSCLTLASVLRAI